MRRDGSVRTTSMLRLHMPERPPADWRVVAIAGQLAAALSFDERDEAPVVAASGYGHASSILIRLAGRHNVPVVHAGMLAQELFRDAEPGEEIPVKLYEKTAELLAYVEEMSGVA